MRIFNRRPIGMCFLEGGDDEGGGVGGDDKIDIDINLGGQGEDDNVGTGTDNVFEIPESYKEKEWAKGIKTAEDLWKMNDNSQSLLGKKLGVPGDNATPEEVSLFNKAFGVPETAEAYEFKDSDNFKAVFGEEARDSEIVKEVQGVFHKAGLSTKQAEQVREGYDGILSKVVAKFNADKEAADAEFETLADKTFGSKKDEILDTSKNLINAHAPEGFKDYMDKLPNTALMVMAGVLGSIQEKYILEDDLPGGNRTTVTDAATIRSEMQKILGSPEFNNPIHSGNKDAKDRYWALSTQLTQAEKAKK